MITRSSVAGVQVDVCIADPRADNIKAAFKIGATVKDLAQGADVAANLNYANNETGTPIGRVIIDGKQMVGDIPKTAPRDELYMLDGALHIGKAPKGVTWALQGSPRLLTLGQKTVKESIIRDQLDSSAANGSAYRIAHGLTVDGRLIIARTRSTVTLDKLADIMLELGCLDAINGDGGGSAYLWPSDDGWGRKMGAALVIKRGDSNMKLIGDSKPGLVIDPGHGGSDPGASGNGIVEKELTLAISLYQFARFKELGVKIALTRDTDTFLDSTPRASLVAGSGAKYCISNHINAASSTTAAGVETIHSIHSDGKLAHALMQAVADAGQIKRKTPVFTKQQSDGKDWYFMHRLTGSVSTVIVEYGFLSNTADADRLKANWQTYAEAVVRAYCLFIGHKYEPPAAPEQPVTPPQDVVEGFTDIAGHWARASIVKAKRAGVMQGIAADRFGPDETMTRAQLAVILDRLGLLD